MATTLAPPIDADQPPAPRPAPRQTRFRGDDARRFNRVWGWVLVIGLFVAWDVLTVTEVVVHPDFPPLREVLSSWYTLMTDGGGTAALLITLRRAMTGFALAALVAVPVGMAMGLWRVADVLLEPLVEILRPIPATALVPLLILLVGIGDELKVFLSFVAAFFPILINTYAGTRGVSTTLRQTALTFRLGWVERIRRVVLPAAAPSIFVGLRLGITVALVVSVVTEMLASNNGMGYLVYSSQQMMVIDRLYAGVLTLGLAGYVLTQAFNLVERRVIFWSDRVRAGKAT